VRGSGDLDVIILCGGRGTRLSEKTDTVPKPLVEIGNYPILWHIMKYYSAQNFNRFIVALGYKGDLIKDWFVRTYRIGGSFELDLKNPCLPPYPDDWRILFLNTGLNSGTACRLRQAKDYITGEQFMVAYGDCVVDVDLNKVLALHNEMKRKKGILMTITAHRSNSKFGIIKEDGNIATSFIEKPSIDDWAAIGFMVCEKEIFNFSFPESPESMFEADFIPNLAKNGKLAVFKHEGFFCPMDTYKDYVELNAIWERGEARWKIW
jgi:glucose-1-phosphate cytidylyltransferase